MTDDDTYPECEETVTMEVHDPATCPCPLHAKKTTSGKSEYQRDYMRGLRQRAAGKPMEENASDAYRAGWGRIDRG